MGVFLSYYACAIIMMGGGNKEERKVKGAVLDHVTVRSFCGRGSEYMTQ